VKNSTLVPLALPLVALTLSAWAAAATKQQPAEPSAEHLVTFISGDIVASPQKLRGAVEGGKADLSGTLKATYDLDKWISNFNDGDVAAFQVLREAQLAAGGALTGTAEIKVDAGAVVKSYIEVSIELEQGTYTIKVYTCVDYPHTTVTETAKSIVVSQTGGTACAYKYPVCSFANEGEDLVYSIQK
jgi:hypothetical protein